MGKRKSRDPSENSSQSPPHIDHHSCYGCGDSLDGIFCQRCTCESCGNGAHYGYNCPPKVLIISNPEPCYNQNVDEFPQTLPSFHPIYYSKDENSKTYNSNLNFVDDSPNPPPQPSMYSYEFCGNDSHYGHDCPPQIPIYYDDDDDEESSIPLRDSIIFELPSCIAITPVLSTEEPFNTLIMEDEHLDIIPATKSDEVIKSSVKDLVPVLSESEGIFDDTCDVPFCDNSPPLDVLSDHFEIFSDFNDDCTSSDDDSFEDIDYDEASPTDSEPFSLEEVKDEILCVKLLNINLLIAKIESLYDNPTPNLVLKSPSPFPILVEDSNSFFEKSDTSLSYSDNSLPKFETFSDHTKETSSGSTTTHVDNSLPEECSSFGALYTKSFGCSKESFADKFVRNANKTTDSSQRPPRDCPKCGNPVDDFLNTSESSNDDPNVVNAPQEPIVFNLNPGEDSSQSPPQIDHKCCYGCGDPLDGIFCRRCTCESCGTFSVIHQPPQETSVEILHDHENDRVSKIKNAVGNKQYKSEDVQELFRKLLNDVQNIHEELAKYIKIPSWNHLAFSNHDDDDDDEDYTIAITPE
nr:hypothetical protein [Tanacetum cinerariifolium]